MAIPLFIFAIALIPRCVDLGTGLTADERLWLERAPEFFDAVQHQDWAGTYQAPHPGVTTMWIAGISMFLLRVPGMEFSDLLISGRLPVVLVTSVAVVIAYFLLKYIAGSKLAFLAAVFIALDPFFIAYSRFIHVDALLTAFMLLSVLSLLAYLKETEKQYLLAAAGFFAGLALLTKLPALFLLLFIPFVVLVWNIWWRPGGKRGAPDWRQILGSILLFGIVCGVTCVALWPSIWVAPANTLYGMVADPSCGLLKATVEPHGTGFFFGEISDGNYGPLFYPVALLMRLTPLVLVFSLVCLGFILYKGSKREFRNYELFLVVLILYIILFSLQMAIARKEMDRYILPVFPILDILAAAGICYGIRAICDRFRAEGKEKTSFGCTGVLFTGAIVAVIIIQSALIIPVTPYFNSYFNPVAFGGPTHAPEIVLVGWGEGNDLAAEYLNQKPDAANLTVAYQYFGFPEYFGGKSIRMGDLTQETDPYPDYLVFYISGVQRHYDIRLWDEYQGEAPEKVITLNGIDYCWIYRTDTGRATG
ncbi:phospholipid carrier-dependent glycosyltransferase [Methanolinea mesophila]|uniref:phospholipid carrier-dependent glycosyltransferase n=1 Tax=Methanolinea mesophila TaxID=547055 RepID=UPI001AE19A24